ncbi:MAG: amidase [Rhodospirillales bacterium]|nr:amidase [Rhodospirillales bacterium]
MKTLKEITTALETGATTSEALVKEALEQIKRPDGEGERVFIKVHEQKALVDAKAVDARRKNGEKLPPLAGIPLSLKDLFDEAGEVTKSGSIALKNAPPAVNNAIIVARLRAAGAIIIGRTNMTEFAFSGIGLNPHYGTPKNPFDRENPRIPGGSTSGGAISVTDGMAAAAIGTDTGGSVRIPSALCGLTGFKPTAKRIPLTGTFPLSTSLDSIGPLAPSLACCHLLDTIMAGDKITPIVAKPISQLRLAVPQSFVLDGMDKKVAHAFDRAFSLLSKSGAKIEEIPLTELLDIPEINKTGGLAAPEAYALHRPILANKADQYDQRVRQRIEGGAKQSAADYIDLNNNRKDLQQRVSTISRNYDALLMPTTPIVAPTIASLEKDEEYLRVNMLMLRNPSVGNFLDRCAVSLPIHEKGAQPVGLMVMGEHMGDTALKSISLAIEKALKT